MSISGISGFGWPLQAADKDKTRQNLLGNAVSTETSSSVAALAASSGAQVSTLTAVPAAKSDDATEQFTSYMKKTPAQRMMDTWLQQHGISQEQFDSMSSAEKQKILDEMKQDMETKMKQKVEADSKASSILA